MVDPPFRKERECSHLDMVKPLVFLRKLERAKGFARYHHSCARRFSARYRAMPSRKRPFPRKGRSWWRWPLRYLGRVAIGLSIIAAIVAAQSFWGRAGDDSAGAATARACAPATVIDGDTIDCGGVKVRLLGIDAPEMPGHCRPGRECTPGDPYASTAALRALLAGGEVTCRPTGTDHYGRTLARCSVGGEDLSCAQIEGGHAVQRYSRIWCW